MLIPCFFPAVSSPKPQTTIHPLSAIILPLRQSGETPFRVTEGSPNLLGVLRAGFESRGVPIPPLFSPVLPLRHTPKLSRFSIAETNWRAASHQPRDKTLAMPPAEDETLVVDGNAADAAATAAQKERQRVTKACDHCNQIRTKCDGVSPCSRCIAYQVACTFDRKSRRNGRKRRRATPPLLGRHPWPRPGAGVAVSSSEPEMGLGGGESGTRLEARDAEGDESASQSGQQVAGDGMQGTMPTGLVNNRPLLNIPVPQTPAEPGQRGGFEPFNGYEPQLFGHLDGNGVSSLPPYLDEYITPAWQGFTSEAHAAYPDKTLFGTPTPGYSGNRLPPGFPRSEIGGGAGLQSRTPRSERSGRSVKEPLEVEYPVIIPLLPFCSHQISPALACKLLEGYFSTFSDHDAYASSPFIISHVLRKQSFLSTTSFRDCKPALLSSMLLVAAQTVEMPFFGSAPTARHRLCQGLFEITVTLLSSNPPSSRYPHGTTPGEKTAIAQERRLVGSSQSLSVLAATRTIDDVIAYMNLAVISSAAESKSVGSHWWHTAVQLAKELKLNLELPPAPTRDSRSSHRHETSSGAERPFETTLSQLRRESQANPGVPPTTAGADSTSPIGMVDNTVTEDDGRAQFRAGLEDQEERRRVWWCLYVLDRHMAICYNSPLALRDTDCQDLMWPLDDASWQAGAYWSDTSSRRGTVHADPDGPLPPMVPSLLDRPTGPSAECIGPGIFGLFIPFAFLLGQIIDSRQLMSQLHYKTPRAKEMGQIMNQEINGQLETFKATFDRLVSPARSKEWDATGQAATGTPASDQMAPTRLRYQRLMVTYGHYFYHILGVLLHSEWDLLTALSEYMEGSDRTQMETSTIASPVGDSTALSCATQAAEALQNVLSQDHELKFNPFLMGIFLVQGSYPLLVAASKDMQRASTQVLKACKITVRAHEASVATLHAEYQVKHSSWPIFHDDANDPSSERTASFCCLRLREYNMGLRRLRGR